MSFLRLSLVSATGFFIPRHGFSRSVYYFSSTRPPNPLQEAMKELKGRNPLTGEKRIGKDFNYKMELSCLATRLGHSIKTLPSLSLALTHHSVLPTDLSQEDKDAIVVKHNSELITLGESSLVYCIHRYLKQTYPNLKRYMIDDITDSLTNHTNLDKISRYLGVANLLMTREEPSEELFAKTLAAVFGAVRRDCGNKAVLKLVNDFILPQIKNTDMRDLLQFRRPRLTLRALLKAQGRSFPVARIIKETGRLTHFPTFVIGFYCDGVLIGEGAGTSLKRAQDEAASAALRDHFMSGIKVPNFITSCQSNVRQENNKNIDLNS